MMTASVHGVWVAVGKRSDAILLNDFHLGVQRFLVSGERFISYNGGILFVYDLQYPARFVFAAIDADDAENSDNACRNNPLVTMLPPSRSCFGLNR
jgi:hypothetical protein